MNQQEKVWFGKAVYDTFAGILANNQEFMEGKSSELLHYDFHCPEYKELIQKYHLKQIAKKGSSFIQARRLMNYFARRLHHESNYDNHIECNALALLTYSLNQKDKGINCLNKAKILTECCLALNIYARRVSLMPYSPYDYDNHVVVEIYDENLQKWIMLDPTTNTYFMDDKHTPLSCLEIRKRASLHQFLTSFKPSQDTIDHQALFLHNIENNYYIIKNMFYFYLDAYNGFGVKDKRLIVAPRYFDVKKKTLMNLDYKIQEYQKRSLSPLIIQTLQQHKLKVENDGIQLIPVSIMEAAPL